MAGTEQKILRIRCPQCRTEVAGPRSELRYRPFCSERCKLLDLGKWLGEEYRISRPATEGETPDGAEREDHG